MSCRNRFVLIPLLALAGLAHTHAATLQHYYPFDTNAKDSMGVTNLTSVGNSVVFQATGGAASGYLKLGGSDDYLLASTGSGLSVLGDYSSTFRSFSLSCWVRQTAAQAASSTIGVIGMTTSSTVTSSAIPNFNTGFELATRESSAGLGVRVRCRAGGTGDGAGALITGLNVANGEWHHLVVNFEAGGRSVYVDGVLAGSSTTAVAFAVGQPITRFAVGAFLRDTQIVDDLNGDVDDLQIYNGALTATEALQLFQNPGLTLNNNLPPPNTTDILPAGTPLSDVVDTMIGVAGGSGTGATVPGPCLPWSSIYPSPDTVTAAAGGYQAGSDTIGFSQLHATGSGSSTMSFGNFLVSPRIGANTTTNEDDNASPLGNVMARPYSYRGRLVTPGVDCTVVPTANCAIYQFDFPASTDARLYFDVARKLNATNAMTSGSVTVDVANGSISGGGTFDSNWNPAAYNVYFYAKLDTTPSAGGTWLGSTPTDGALSVTTSSRQRIGSWVRFNTSTNRTVRMKIGISFQSVAKAQQYVEAEIPAWDLAGLETTAKGRWNDTLGVLQTPGISKAEARKLYTALFHSLIQPRNRTGDPTGWPADAPFWDDQYTPWDTWQTLYPLLDIVSPASVASIVNSFGERYARNGKAETAFIQGKDFQVGQGGDEVDRIIADAYVKGIPGIDWAKIWPLLQFNAGRRTDDYRNLGFVSIDGSHNGYDSRMASGSSTIAFAHGDWCAAQIGTALGHTAEAQALLVRSENWRNVWDSALTGDGFSGFVHGKNRNGTFSSSAATASSDFYQGTCWNYSFNVFDRDAMIDLMGGRARFIQRLEFAFGKNSTSYLDFGNEVNLQAVPLLSRAQRPGLSAFWADNVRNRFSVYNCPGDEDSGAMSSLYFFLTAGFVPAATEDTYYLHGARVPRLEFNMGGGHTFTVTAANAGGPNIYVQSATLDGQPLDTPVIHHSDITAGKTLAFVMGPNPTTWGTGVDFSRPEGGVQIPVNAGWTAALGAPQIIGATSHSPVWGDGSNGADNTAIYSAFPEVTLSQPGASITLSATVTLNGMATTQPAPNARFAWGLFNVAGQSGVTGWPGYLAGNDTVDVTGKQLVWRKDSGNTTAFHSSASATTLTPYSLPTPAFADGTYRLVMTLVRLASGALDYHAALVRSSDGVLFAAFTGSDLSPPTYNFNRAGMRVGDVLDVDSVHVSEAIVITSGIPSPPTVSIKAPAEGAEIPWPTAINIATDAAGTGGKTVSKVEFFANGIKIGEATSAPYSFVWSGMNSGPYVLTAVVTDSDGETAMSPAVNIVSTRPGNVAPSVAITAPVAGTVTAGSINITASASDTDGVVSKVEFFNGATKLGQATTVPYTFTWSSVAVGTYTLSAKATDNDGAVTTSAEVVVHVQPAPLSLSENFDSMGANGTTPPAGWSVLTGNSGTDKTTWGNSIPGTGTDSVASMVAVSGGLTVNNAPTTTNNNGYNAQGVSSADRVLSTSPTSISGAALQFSVANSTGSPVTALRIGYDVRRYTAETNELPGYWLFYSLNNGTTWTNVSALNSTAASVPNTVGVTTIPAVTFNLSSAWASGATLLLRWVDDNAEQTSPDQIIGLDNVSISVPVGQPPVVTLTAPTAGAVRYVDDVIQLTADASDSDGSIVRVEFYQGATKLGEDTEAPYAYDWSGFDTGSYSLAAKAVDDDGNASFSAVAGITVLGTPGSGTLTRGPYLNQANQNSIVIRWRSSMPVVGRVSYGTTEGSLTTTVDESAATTEHIVQLTGLNPYTRYYYSVGSAHDTLAGGAGDSSGACTFRTSPMPDSSTDTRIWVVGDCGRASQFQKDVLDAYYGWTGSRTPDLCLMLGDNAYNSGTDVEYQAGFYDIYPTFFRKMPLWSCMGNHDANNGSTSTTANFPYFDMFTFPTNGECGGVASGTEHYNSFDYGNIHFINLDSQTSVNTGNGPMAQWLQNDLASTTKTWIIAFFHHPPYSKGSHDSDTEGQMVAMRQNFDPILENGGVDLVLVGHSHAYERSVLLDGHYGVSSTLTAGMKKNAGSGRPAGSGAYIKPLTGPRDHFGTVYTVTGSAGEASGGALNHPVMYVSYNTGGTFNIDITGPRLEATYVEKGATVGTFTTPDTFTILKQGAADSDGDGLTDEFETANGLNRHSASDAEVDSDGDGVTNLVEFAFGTDPGTGSSSALEVSGGILTKRGGPVVKVTSIEDGVDFSAAFCRRKDQSAAGLTYTVQFSADLLTWESSVVTPSIIADDGTYEVVSVSYPFAVNGVKARFFRVSVSAN